MLVVFVCSLFFLVAPLTSGSSVPTSGAPSTVPKCRLDMIQPMKPRHYGWGNHGHDSFGGRPQMGHEHGGWGPEPNRGKNPSCPETSTEYNKNYVLCFYEESFGLGHFSTAVQKYVNPTNYIQHNPGVGDGVEAFLEFAGPDSTTPPSGPLEIHHVAADGDLVWIHIKDTSSTPPSATVDIFRMECGKIVEHWDVIQPMNGPFANAHPFF